MTGPAPVVAQEVVAAYRRAGLRLATAESCTGGLIAAAVTDVAGSSAVFERGYVTYSNEAKREDLGVAPEILEVCGAVSGEAAAAMAAGVLGRSPADVAVAVTGIAGPGGAVPGKPVGLVWFGLARRGRGPAWVERHVFSGDRADVRAATVARALELLLGAAE